MYLLDTNIFIKILLEQAKEQQCSQFIENNLVQISISDFSLHSIGVILFRNQKENLFREFLDDVIVLFLFSPSYPAHIRYCTFLSF